jgi:pyrimidine-nucleoside phosphorylase
MVLLAKKADTLPEARAMLERSIRSVHALQSLKMMLRSQGGDDSFVDNPSLLPAAKHRIEIVSRESGHVAAIAADRIGKAAMILGAGRATKESDIGPETGPDYRRNREINAFRN